MHRSFSVNNRQAWRIRRRLKYVIGVLPDTRLNKVKHCDDETAITELSVDTRYGLSTWFSIYWIAHFTRSIA